MRVADAIKLLKEEDQNAEILIEWFTKEDIESHNETKIDLSVWNLAARLYNKYGVTEESLHEINSLVALAKERIESQ